MSKAWPLVKLGELLSLDLNKVVIDSTSSYDMVGVYSFGRGLFNREPIFNGNTSYKYFYKLSKEHIVMSQLFGWEGALAISSKEFDGKHVSPQFPTFLADQNKLNRQFLGWYMRQPKFWEALGSRTRGMGDRRRTLNPDALFQCQIPLPPLAEQQRIVAKIERLAGKIEEARVLRQQLKSSNELLLAAHTNAIFSNNETIKWPSYLLGDIAEIKSGVTLGRSLIGRTVRLPYLRVANVQDGHLDLSVIKEVEVLENEVDKWKLKFGDILLTEGGDWDKLGRGTIWKEQIQNCIHQNHIFRVRINPNEFYPEFLAAVISSPAGKSYFQSASKQTTNLASINQRQLKAFPVSKPPLLTQRKILTILQHIQSEINHLKSIQTQTAVELDALLPSILDRAFKGEL